MNKRRSLIWLLYPSYLAIVLLSLVAAGWVVYGLVESSTLRQVESSLVSQAWIFEDFAADLLEPARADELQRVCQEIGRRTGTRLTVIRKDGSVAADSKESPELMKNHLDRPEVGSALRGEVGTAVRTSPTLGGQVVYAAVPVGGTGHVRAVVRTALPLTFTASLSRGELEDMVLGGAAIVLGAALVAWLMALGLNQPLRRLRADIERLGASQLDGPLFVPRIEEYAVLSETISELTSELAERLATITAQRNEIEAVLSGMDEPVLVVDADERLVRVNRAAAELFGIDPQAARGRTLYRAIRSAELTNLVGRTLSCSGPQEEELSVGEDGEVALCARGTALLDDRGRPEGALVVMHDVTGFKRLEALRRDFVANASHELRTPITSIHGFIETLQSGAIDDPDAAKRFLDIASRQTERLCAIVEGLLSLSRLEGGDEALRLNQADALVGPVLEEALTLLRPLADKQGVALTLECPADLMATFDEALLEQAVVNLVDNAIKHSEAGSKVRLEARRDEESGELLISVTDQGCGISAAHLPRIFERFYRVDKARSRHHGGTGLGLSIVKHIAQVHGGRVSVWSEPGKGSAFTLALPLDGDGAQGLSRGARRSPRP